MCAASRRFVPAVSCFPSVSTSHALLLGLCAGLAVLPVPRATATELLSNRSFDATNDWNVAPAILAQTNWNGIAGGQAYMHPIPNYIGVVYYQDLNVPAVGGATGTGKITLNKNFAPAGVSTIMVTLDYRTTGGQTNTLTLFTVSNDAVTNAPATSSFQTSFTLPATADALIRCSLVKTNNGQFNIQDVSLDMAIVRNAGFETGDFTSWIKSPAFSITNTGVHAGTRAAYADCSLAPHSFVSQDVASRLQPDVSYRLSAWVYLRPGDYATNTPDEFIPHLCYGTDFAFGIVPPSCMDVADRTVSGWQEVKLITSFSASELATNLYLGVAKMGVDGVFAVDDIAITPVIGEMTDPWDGATYTDITNLLLRARVTLEGDRTVALVQFLNRGTVIGSAARDLHGEWSFPDGSHLSLMSGGMGEMVDYTLPGFTQMYAMGGNSPTPTNFYGNFTTWTPDPVTGAVSIVFTLLTNDHLTARMTGDSPLGTVTLSDGTNNYAPMYAFLWDTPSVGTNLLSVRVICTDGTTNDSDPVTAYVSVSPPADTNIVQNGSFETGALDYWTNALFGMWPFAVTNAAAHGGAYAAVGNAWGPPNFLQQDIAPRLLPGIAYTFTAWMNVVSNSGAPIPMYIPHLVVETNATGFGASAPSNSIAYVNTNAVGWQRLEFTRSFTTDELMAGVYVKAGGMGLFLIDDVTALPGGGTPSAYDLFAAVYGLTGTNALQDANPDGDACNNWQEFMADTNPTNPASFFRITAVSNQAPGLAVGFVSSSNRIYGLTWTTNLTADAGGWANLPGKTNIRGSGATLFLGDTNSAPARFYRVGVQLPSP